MGGGTSTGIRTRTGRGNRPAIRSECYFRIIYY
jgi:hypothetical protein